MAKASRVFTFLQLVACFGIIFGSWQFHARDIVRLQFEAEQTAEEVLSFINDHLEICRDGLSSMRPEIIANGGNTDRVIQLMNQAVDGANNWGLRYGWSTIERQLIAGSVIGRIEPSYDLSGRAYAEAAIAEPGKVHFDVVQHVIFARPILILAVGITNPEGRFLGTLAALLDITTMNETLKRIALEQRMEISIQSNDGTFIFSNTDAYELGSTKEVSLRSNDDYLIVHARPPASQLKALDRHYLIVSAMMIAMFMLVSRYLYKLYMAKWAAPLTQLAHILNEATGEAVVLKPGSDYDINEVVQKASHIREIIDASQLERAKSQEQAQQLRDALSLIQSFQHEQATFFQSFSVEVEQVADTLEEYLAFVSDIGDAYSDIARKYHLASQLPQLDRPYLLEDTNEHMRYLSLCFLLMCKDITSETNREAHYNNTPAIYDMRRTYGDMLKSLQSQQEDRYISLKGGLVLDTPVDSQIFNVITFASLSMASRHLMHDAALHITLNQDNKTVLLSGRCEQRPPRYAAEEFFDMHVIDSSANDRLVRHLSADIYAYILRYFLRNIGGDLAISMKDHTLGITIYF